MDEEKNLSGKLGNQQLSDRELLGKFTHCKYSIQHRRCISLPKLQLLMDVLDVISFQPHAVLTSILESGSSNYK